MTREEQIKQAVESNLDVSFYTPQDGELLKEVFYIGAKWTDEHPKSPWISVKDDLPCNHNELIHRDAENAWTECCVTSDGTWTITNRMILIEGEWNWGIPNVKYWFAVPELPKE